MSSASTAVGITDSSTEDIVLGYLAVIGANIFFGSHAVPVKKESVLKANVDPVIYQTYKTIAVFVTSWLVLTYKEFTFTWWGFVGASMWVPNGVLAVIAIRSVGLGVTLGLTGGITVWVSFVCGASLLHQPVNSWPVAVISLVLLAIGIAGVTLTNAAGIERNAAMLAEETNIQAKEQQDATRTALSTSNLPAVDVSSSLISVLPFSASAAALSAENEDTEACSVQMSGSDESETDAVCLKMTELVSRGLSPHNLGILIAAFIGVSQGAMMLPLSFAPPAAQSITYIISFGIGALGINVGLLAVYYLLLLWMGRPVPSFQVKVAAGPALLTGTLWSAGNYCSTYATLYLGDTIGYPLVQCNLLVAGLWGIFYYHEIRGVFLIGCFLMWTSIVLVGVFMLSFSG